MAIKAGKIIARGSQPAAAKKMRRENKPNVKMTADMKPSDKKIRAEDKRGSSVRINKPEQQVTKSSTREVLKPSRYVEDLMKN